MGMVFVVDRLKEILKVRGFQVAPAELEGHLLGHPFVTDVCVIGAPDEFSGEAPMAFVVPSSEAKRLIKTGPRGVSEVKITITKASFYHSAGVFLDVNQNGLTDSTSRMPRWYKHLSGGIELVDTIPKNPSGNLLRSLMQDRARALKEQTKDGLTTRL